MVEALSPDRIVVSGIEVWAHHGVLPTEIEQGQRFLIDVEVALSLQLAAESDDLTETIDYGVLAVEVRDLVARERWNLIERVAERVAALVLTLPRAESVKVTVHKPEAPIEVRFADVAVTIHRRRS